MHPHLSVQLLLETSRYRDKWSIQQRQAWRHHSTKTVPRHSCCIKKRCPLFILYMGLEKADGQGSIFFYQIHNMRLQVKEVSKSLYATTHIRRGTWSRSGVRESLLLLKEPKYHICYKWTSALCAYYERRHGVCMYVCMFHVWYYRTDLDKIKH
jgi:hypothetical protein